MIQDEGEKMDNISERELERLRLEYRKMAYDRNKEAAKLCANSDYLTWLKNFTKSYPEFRSDDWSLLSERTAVRDRKNIKKLSLLYTGIENYAEAQEELFPRLTSYGNYYSIEYQGIGYQIGRRTISASTAYCCKRVHKKQLINPINFIEVQNFSLEKLSERKPQTYQKRR